MSYNCPKCGSEFEKSTKFCQTCGCNLELEYIENPVCPKCKTSFPTNTKFCVNDGSKLARPEDLIPKCVICNTSYSDDIKFCPRDGGEVKIILTRQFSQPTYGQTQFYQKFGTNQKYPKASSGNRFLAALLDGLISLGLSIPAIIFFALGMAKAESYYDKDGAIGLFFIAFLFYIIPLVYNFIKDGLGQGQSWGKKALDLMVVNLDNNAPCDKGKSFFRNFISGLVAIIPFVGWLIEPIMVLATEDGRKLGDKAANTQVIDKNNFYNKINMNCLRCNTENEEGVKFCKNCGMDMTYTPSKENTNSNQTVNQLLLLMGIEYFIDLGWFILQKAIVPILFKKDDIVDWDKVLPIYKYFGWTTDILSVIVLLIFAIIIKNKNARIFLIIFLVLRIIFLIGFRVFEEV